LNDVLLRYCMSIYGTITPNDIAFIFIGIFFLGLRYPLSSNRDLAFRITFDIHNYAFFIELIMSNQDEKSKKVYNFSTINSKTGYITVK